MSDMPMVAERALVGDKPEVALVLEGDEVPHRSGLVGVMFLVAACLAALMPLAAHIGPYPMVTVCSKCAASPPLRSFTVQPSLAT